MRDGEHTQSDDESNDRKERARGRDEPNDFEDSEDRPARRRRDEGDATGGLIPYKNPKALISYYFGVLGLITCILFLGFLGIIPIILGFLGLKHARQHPETKGQVHAYVGIVLGFVQVLTFIAQLVFIIPMIIKRA